MLKPENVNLLHYGVLTYSKMTKKINFSVNFSQWTSQERGHCHPQCWRENTSSQMGDHWQVSKKPSSEDKICHIRRWDDKTDRIVLRIRWQGNLTIGECWLHIWKYETYVIIMYNYCSRDTGSMWLLLLTTKGILLWSVSQDIWEHLGPLPQGGASPHWARVSQGLPR